MRPPVCSPRGRWVGKERVGRTRAGAQELVLPIGAKPRKNWSARRCCSPAEVPLRRDARPPMSWIQFFFGIRLPGTRESCPGRSPAESPASSSKQLLEVEGSRSCEEEHLVLGYLSLSLPQGG